MALTVFAASTVTTQLPTPVQLPPSQPVNTTPDPGDAVSVITEPALGAALHTLGQLIPAPVTVPEPLTVMVNTGFCPPEFVRLKLNGLATLPLVAVATTE